MAEYTELIVGGIFSLVLWFMKRTIDKQDERMEALEKSQTEIKTEYVHKNEFKDFKLELREMFQEIKQDIRDLKK